MNRKTDLRFAIVASLVLATLTTASGEPPALPQYIDSDGVVIATVPNSSAHLAYSKNTGKWRIHRFPGGMIVVPVIGDGFAVFKLGGRPVSELVGVDQNGN